MELNTHNIAGDTGDGDSIDGAKSYSDGPKSSDQSTKVGRGIYIPPPPDSRPCVVCKKVHLSCDRMRPCGRCIRLQREADCCDPPSSRRGRKSRDVPEPLEEKRTDEHSTSMRVKLEKRQRGNDSISPEPPLEASPRTVPDRFDDPLTMAIREGSLRMFWNHYHIVGCTQEYAAMLGYKQEELLGMPWAMLHPPELSEFYIRGMDSYLPKIPEYVTEVDNSCELVMLARNGRRFQILCEYKMFLRNREPLMGWTIIRGITRDNLPPGYIPPPQGPLTAFSELWNRMPAVRAPQPSAEFPHSLGSSSAPLPRPSALPPQPTPLSNNNLIGTAQLQQSPHPHLFQPIASCELSSSSSSSNLNPHAIPQQSGNAILRPSAGPPTQQQLPLSYPLTPAQQQLLMQQQQQHPQLAVLSQQNNVVFTTPSGGMATGSHMTVVTHSLSPANQSHSQSPFMW